MSEDKYLDEILSDAIIRIKKVIDERNIYLWDNKTETYIKYNERLKAKLDELNETKESK